MVMFFFFFGSFCMLWQPKQWGNDRGSRRRHMERWCCMWQILYHLMHRGPKRRTTSLQGRQRDPEDCGSLSRMPINPWLVTRSVFQDCWSCGWNYQHWLPLIILTLLWYWKSNKNGGLPMKKNEIEMTFGWLLGSVCLGIFFVFFLTSRAWKVLFDAWIQPAKMSYC
jgi:hypothetical protein